MPQSYAYIVTNKPDGTLYIGVTSNLIQRIYQHKRGIHDGFAKRYNLHKLVYYEIFDDINDAIRREKQLKKHFRYQKIELIERMNPGWNDLTAAITA